MTNPRNGSPTPSAQRLTSNQHHNMSASAGIPGSTHNEDVAARLRHTLRNSLKARLPNKIDEERIRLGNHSALLDRKELAQEILIDAAQRHSEQELINNRPLLPTGAEEKVVNEVLDEFFGIAGLQPLLDDPTVETINANRWDQVFVQYADGSKAQVAPIAESNQALTDLVRILASRASSEERRFDRGAPSVNVQLPGGERLFAVMALTTEGVTALSIRRHGYLTTTLPELRSKGTIDPGLEHFLSALVRARKNILITGGTRNGKTTLLRAMASEMDPMERIVTIEDAFELGLGIDPTLHADVTALQAREANFEGVGEVTQADLVRWALRMSPDRVIVGEIRGPEVIPMCNAMSQGNDGSMATLHASSAQIAFSRLAAYAVQGPERLPIDATNLLVANAVHFVVHLERATDRVTRVISSIREIVAADGLQIVSNEVYRPGPDRRARPVAGALRTNTLNDLAEVGFDPNVLARPEGWWQQ